MKSNLKIKLYELFDEWLNYKRTKVKESTYFNYSFVVNECLKKYFKNVSDSPPCCVTIVLKLQS